MDMKLVYLKLKQHIRTLAYINQDQDDLLQEAMLKVLRSKSYKSGFGYGWLYSVARSTVIDAHKRRVKEPRKYSAYVDSSGRVCEGDDDNVIYHPTHFDPYHEVCPEDLTEIPEILNGLSFEHQEVLLLYANGLTYQEIAHMVGLKVGTVRSRLHFARRYAHKVVEEMRKKEKEEVENVTWH